MQEGATNMTGACSVCAESPSHSSKHFNCFAASSRAKEIADRLDKLLAQVEATQARLAHIPDIIKRFRQLVLAAAVRVGN